MDLARSKCYLEYRPARVRCPEHGVLVERVPRARGVGGRTDRKPLYVSCPSVRTRQGRPTDRGQGPKAPVPCPWATTIPAPRDRHGWSRPCAAQALPLPKGTAFPRPLHLRPVTVVILLHVPVFR